MKAKNLVPAESMVGVAAYRTLLRQYAYSKANPESTIDCPFVCPVEVEDGGVEPRMVGSPHYKTQRSFTSSTLAVVVGRGWIESKGRGIVEEIFAMKSEAIRRHFEKYGVGGTTISMVPLERKWARIMRAASAKRD